MAEDSTGKKSGKKKTKSQPIPLGKFLANTSTVNAGSTAKEPPPPKRTQSWADESEHLESDDTPEWPSKSNFDRTVLPSAPRAATAVKVDLSRLPPNPPYTIYLGNLPYDCSEEDIKEFFQRKKVQVSNVRLPKEGTTNRPKGFGYAELGTRQDLEEALALTGETLKNRALKIDLAGGKNQDDSRGGGGGYGRREYQQHDDRTSTNWRTAGPEEGEGSGEKDGPWPRRNEDSYNDHSSEDRDGGGYRDGGYRGGGYRDGGNRDGGHRDGGYRDGGYRDGGYRDGGDRYSRNHGEGGDRDRRGYDRGGRRDGPSDRSGPPGYGDRDRYGDRRRQDGGRYERGPGHNDDHEDRRPRDEERRRHSPEREAPLERPKLNLKPRSKPKEEGDGAPVATSSIFGGAKPVDTATREKEIEERLLKEKEEVKSPREKADKSSIFGGAKPVDTASKEKEIDERLKKNQEKEGLSGTGDEERQPRLHSKEDEKSPVKTMEPSSRQDGEPSDADSKKAQSKRSGPNADHGSEDKGGKGRSSCTVYLGNLSYECDAQDIAEFFEKRDVKVTSVRIPRDSSTNRVKGFGYAELSNKEDLEHALSLDGEMLRGRAVKVDQAKDKDDARNDHYSRDRDGRFRGGNFHDDRHRDERHGRHGEERHGRHGGEERPQRSGDLDKRPSRENPWKGKPGQKVVSPPPSKERGIRAAGESTEEVTFSYPSRFAALGQDSSGDEKADD